MQGIVNASLTQQRMLPYPCSWQEHNLVPHVHMCADWQASRGCGLSLGQPCMPSTCALLRVHIQGSLSILAGD